MTEESTLLPSSSDADESVPSRSAETAGTDAGFVRLEARLARAEAQLRTLGDRIDEMSRGERSRKQRALMIRLALLAILMGLFFVMQFMRGAK